jgi:glycolate oxidase iron-sulfur subunit
VYAITQPEQADLLLRRKTANIVGTGAAWVATSNPGCHLQIARGLDSAGARVQVAHPVSLLARAYRRENPESLITNCRIPESAIQGLSD